MSEKCTRQIAATVAALVQENPHEFTFIKNNETHNLLLGPTVNGSALRIWQNNHYRGTAYEIAIHDRTFERGQLPIYKININPYGITSSLNDQAKVSDQDALELIKKYQTTITPIDIE